MDLFDSHTHLNSREFAGEVDATLARARAAGVRRMMVVGYDLPSSRKAVEVAREHEGLFASVGIHPHDAKDFDDRAAAELAVMASDPCVVAFGEIGLDFYRNLSPKDAQVRAFQRQIRMARELDLPVIIHSRDAYEEVLDVLRDEKLGPRGGVMHCFSSGIATARRCLEIGLLIGIAGPVTYKKNEELRTVAREVPAESLLVETDCPYLTPEPLRGKRNEPAYVARVAEQVARERGISPDELAALTTRNAERLFRK